MSYIFTYCFYTYTCTGFIFFIGSVHVHLMCVYSTVHFGEHWVTVLFPLNIDMFLFGITQVESMNNQNIHKPIPSYFIFLCVFKASSYIIVLEEICSEWN